ncbi:hypothetical protein R1T08_26165 [Streptomyces sp. SBC-4]|nr:hypothetical protein [Streptomyces sp. SBC-4]MDV5147563.1 hypothetical protein [Streptomyces sp. SBC-4]
MNSDAKVLLLVVQGLPEKERYEALGKYAEALELTPREYRNARKQLIANGYLHEWKWQNERGRWVTDQLTSNVTLTDDEAIALRDGNPPESPSDRESKVGSSRARGAQTYKPVDKDCEKTSPHPPSKARAEREPAPEPPQEPQEPKEPEEHPSDADPDPDPELFEAERLLLSLRHSHKDLLLGVREARGLADQAAEWLRRGISAADLRRALTAYLPSSGVRSAVGFLRHRLTEKMPAPTVPDAPPEPPARPAPLIACEGPGNPHVFRPADGETHCGPCRTDAAWEEHERRHGQPQHSSDSGPVAWRDHFGKYAQGLIT